MSEKKFYQVKSMTTFPVAYEQGRFTNPQPYEMKYNPFREMKVCDYFVIPCESMKRIDMIQKRVSSCALAFAKNNNKNVIFITRRVSTGVACIRVS